MRLYELVLVLKSSLSDEQRNKLVETIKSWLKNIKIIKGDEWGQKVLAYPIKRELSGFYLHFQFEGDSLPSEFEKKLYGQENVLRHLLLRKK